MTGVKKIETRSALHCLWVSRSVQVFKSISSLCFHKQFHATMSSKIVLKKPTASASATSLPKASSIIVPASASLQHKKVVVAAPSSKVIVKAPQKVAAPVKKVAVAPKIIYQQVVEEVEDAEEEPMTAQDIYERIQELLGELVGLSGGRGKIKLTKSGKVRKPRGPRENSEKQNAWMEFVKQVREEQGYEEDENGKRTYAISHKDAMKMAKQLRAGEAGSDESEDVEDSEPAPAPAKKVVVAAKKASPAPPKRSPQQIREELAAAAAKEAEQAQEVEVEEFEHDGKTYLKNNDNLCWLVDADGNQSWAGAYLPDEDRIDSTVEEPLA